MGYTRGPTKVELIYTILSCTNRMNPYDPALPLARLTTHKLMRLRRADLIRMAQDEVSKWEERRIVMCFRNLYDLHALEFEPDAPMGKIMECCCFPDRNGEINGIPTSDIDPQETIKDFCDKYLAPGKCPYFTHDDHAGIV